MTAERPSPEGSFEERVRSCLGVITDRSIANATAAAIAAEADATLAAARQALQDEITEREMQEALVAAKDAEIADLKATCVTHAQIEQELAAEIAALKSCLAGARTHLDGIANYSRAATDFKSAPETMRRIAQVGLEESALPAAPTDTEDGNCPGCGCPREPFVDGHLDCEVCDGEGGPR